MPSLLLTTSRPHRHAIPRRAAGYLTAIAALALVTSCGTLRFYRQAVGGQLEILRKSRPNQQVMADGATSPALRRQLAAVERIRRFASDHLALPGDESYGKYADLGREHVVWVLYAAPEFSLKPKTWYYPAVGKMDYRGYFREQDTVSLAAQLRQEGYDVFVGGVDAYSTLGWFHDPVLNTFVAYPDIDLAETIFHELTHRKVFRRGATVFNESLATVVAEEGMKRWLKHEGRLAELRNYQERLVRRREFYQEIDRSASTSNPSMHRPARAGQAAAKSGRSGKTARPVPGTPPPLGRERSGGMARWRPQQRPYRLAQYLCRPNADFPTPPRGVRWRFRTLLPTSRPPQPPKDHPRPMTHD